MAAMWQRIRKYLRIAVTAVSLLVCVLLIVLWVRSYMGTEYLAGGISKSQKLEAISYKGFIEIMLRRQPPSFPRADWTYETWDDFDYNSEPFWGLYLNARPKLASAPIWFYLTIAATIAALPWLKWRFSLRTLLIVMTLFALFFGAVAWSMRG